jgi:molybdopterin converting factor small subunit
VEGESIVLSRLIEEIAARHGGPSHSTFYTEEGNIRPHFRVLVSGQDIRFPTELQTIVRDGHIVSFIMPIGGG